MALVDDAQREKEVPCTIDHKMNNIPRIRGIDLLALAIMPFSPVVKINNTKIKPAEVTGNKQIRKRYMLRRINDISLFDISSFKVIQFFTVLFFASNAVIEYDAERLVKAMAAKTVRESILAIM